MSIQLLPLELFRAVLAQAILVRGYKRALRLRLVNRLFSTEVVDLLARLRVLDNLVDVQVNQLGSFGVAYISRRLLSNQASISLCLDNIREIAARFADEDAGADSTIQWSECYERYIRDLSSLMTKVPMYRSSRLSKVFAPEHTTVSIDVIEFKKRQDLRAAAAYFGKLSIVSDLTKDGYNRWEERCDTLNDAFWTSLMGGHMDTIRHLLRRNLEARGQWYELQRLLRETSATGASPRAVEYLLASRQSPALRGGEELSMFHDALYTPDLETLEILMRYKYTTVIFDQGKIKEPTPLSESHLSRLLEVAAQQGWYDMAVHLLELGAPVNVPVQGSDTVVSSLPEAFKSDSDAVAPLLLQHGAKITGLEIAVAAARGRLSTVRLLLQHGADPDGGHPDFPQAYSGLGEKPPPVVSAVCLEHEPMFRLLVEHGADLEKHGLEAAKVAQANGLESMLDLLKEYNVSLEEQKGGVIS